MRSAIYYPHTEISEELLKTALLLWDRVLYIAPGRNYRSWYNDKLMIEAVELVGESHVPNAAEKKTAHSYLEDFVSRPLPPPFYYRSQGAIRT
jgi:hypothetical protein